MMTTQEITTLLSRPTITPDELYRAGVLPLSRNGIYDAIGRGEIDVVRIGRKIAVITASLRRQFKLEQTA